MTYRLVIFDFDRTLATLPLDWVSLKRRLQGEFEIDFSSLNEGLQRVGATAGRDGLYRAYRTLEEFESKSLARLEPHDAALAFLKAVAGAGRLVAVFSDNLRSTVQRGLERLGIDRHVAAVVGKDDVDHYKPDPDGLHRILGRLGVSVDQALFVGDSLKDEAAARACGMSFALVDQLTPAAAREVGRETQ